MINLGKYTSPTDPYEGKKNIGPSKIQQQKCNPRSLQNLQLCDEFMTSEELGFFWLTKFGKKTLHYLLPIGSRYGIFPYNLVDFYGKCRDIYHTWMLWVKQKTHEHYRTLV